MSRHDEPNEYGFAGDATAPEPPPRGRRDTTDEAEAVAVPGDDLTAEFAEALADRDRERAEHPDRPDDGSAGR